MDGNACTIFLIKPFCLQDVFRYSICVPGQNLDFDRFVTNLQVAEHSYFSQIFERDYMWFVRLTTLTVFHIQSFSILIF